MTKVSVIITSYNQQDTLKAAIDSVIKQTTPAYEIIVCDDASTDASKKLIQTYEANYRDLIRGYYQKENVGVAKNRNSGLNLASGDAVTWLDGDDIFLSRKLELETSLLSEVRTVKWVYSQVIEYNDILQTRRRRYRNSFDGMIFDKVVSNLGKAPRNPLVNRTALDKVGYFDEQLSLYEDFDLCLRLAKAYPCSFQIRPAMEYIYNPAGLSSRGLQHHWSNIQTLQHNLLGYIRDVSENERKHLEKCFLTSEKVVYLSLINNLGISRKIETLRYAFWAFRHNPVLLSNSLIICTLAELLLPISFQSRLNQFKETFFG